MNYNKKDDEDKPIDDEDKPKDDEDKQESKCEKYNQIQDSKAKKEKKEKHESIGSAKIEQVNNEQ